MARQTTSRLKVNPPLGRMPVLQHMPIGELQIDAAYQRDLAGGGSQTLIRRIAQHWNWDLCQPLAVARRVHAGDQFFVIDGQHRLAAARLRRDIQQLPCVITTYASVAEEAASFVDLNQQRQRLTDLDLFKAALASGDKEATAIAAAMEAAGLRFANTTNFQAWKPGMVCNIGGIRNAWRHCGSETTALALQVLGRAYPDQVLRYAGTIFPGVLAVISDGPAARFTAMPELVDMAVEMIGDVDQMTWRAEIMRLRADEPDLKYSAASAKVFRAAWAELMAEFMDEAA